MGRENTLLSTLYLSHYLKKPVSENANFKPRKANVY